MKKINVVILMLLMLFSTLTVVAENKEAEINRLVRQNTDASIKKAAELYFDNDSIVACMCDFGNPLYRHLHFRFKLYFTDVHYDPKFDEIFPQAARWGKMLSDLDNVNAKDKADWEQMLRRHLNNVVVRDKAVDLNMVQQAFCNLMMSLPGETPEEQEANELEMYDKNHGYIGSRTYKRINGCLGDFLGKGENTCKKIVITSFNDIKGHNFGDVDRVENGEKVGEEYLSMDVPTYNAIKVMDAACQNSSLPFPVNLVKVIQIDRTCQCLGLDYSINTVDEMQKVIKQYMKQGKVICRAPYFMSMSVDAANNYFLGSPKRLVLMRVHCPANVSMYVSCHLQESEVVFPRFAKALVTKVGTMQIKNKEAEGMLDMLTLDMEMY